jgi:hypothetical protein
MVFTEKFFDRYLLPLVPLGILFFMSYKEEKSNLRYLYLVTNLFFALFTAFLSFQMGADFITTNSYVWGRSESLVSEGVKPEDISATMAWGRLHGVSSNPEFLFSFDSPDKNPELLQQYDLFEERGTSFRGSIFVEPKIFLYRAKSGE